jgi:hypothetical protein
MTRWTSYAVLLPVLLLLAACGPGAGDGEVPDGATPVQDLGEPPVRGEEGEAEPTLSAEIAAIDSFAACVEAGLPVMESYPRQCRTPDGRVFAEDVGNELELQDTIRIAQPRPNDVVSSPLAVTGEARGTWYFEASFGMRLEDADGNVLAEGAATTSEDWMTEEFVPFEATLEFEVPPSGEGRLFLEKANPSDLPENAATLEVPVRFGAAGTALGEGVLGSPAEEIGWDAARELILSGQVSQVTQLHSREVTITLPDGRTVTTTEPEIDDVFDLLQECGEPCANVAVATE